MGLEGKHLFLIMLTELLTLTIVGYPIGCVIGNLIAKFIYSDVGSLFSDKSEGSVFYVSYPAAVTGAILMLCFVILIAVRMISEMRRYSDVQMIKSSTSGRVFNRKIYSKKNRDLTGVLTKRFMFGSTKTFVGMIVSLSLGGVIFLGTAYTADCSLKDSEHKRETDKGLKSDISVYINSDDGYEIPDSSADQIRRIEGVKSADRTSYLLGEVPFTDGRFKWTEFYSDTGRNIIKKQSEDSCRVKVNVYGYDDDMIASLEDYLISGDVDAASLRSDNSVVLKTLTDGQGNTDGIDVAAGDTITLKVPVKMSDELLEFDGNDDDYIVREFTVAAVVTRPIAVNENYIGDRGSDVVDIIMTNDQMSDNFDVRGFCNIAVDLDDGADHGQIARAVRQAVDGSRHCLVRDNVDAIEQQTAELHRKERFFYGIAIILLCISLLHVINSMRYIIISRRKEFGIVRAMGISDRRFLRMLVMEGIRYGLYTSILMTVLYLVVHKVLEFMMRRVFLVIVITGDIMPVNCLIMSAVNVLLCVLAVVMAGRELLKESIISEIKV